MEIFKFESSALFIFLFYNFVDYCSLPYFYLHTDSKIPAIRMFLRNFYERGWEYFTKIKIRQEFFVYLKIIRPYLLKMSNKTLGSEAVCCHDARKKLAVVHIGSIPNSTVKTEC